MVKSRSAKKFFTLVKWMLKWWVNLKYLNSAELIPPENYVCLANETVIYKEIGVKKNAQSACFRSTNL